MGPTEQVLSLGDINGKNGFVINDETSSGALGSSVSHAGDVNGDGIDDFIIGAPKNATSTRNGGKSYVVFGRNDGFGKDFNLADLNGKNGFSLIGNKRDELSGSTVNSAGDINGDGLDDLIIGAPNVDSRFPGFDAGAGASYVVFGQKTFSSGRQNLSDLNGKNGFAIRGGAIDDRLGASVSGTGDVNGDGIGDLIVGAAGADFEGKNNAGKSYVVFGKNQNQQRFSPELNLDNLNGNNGFEIQGGALGDGAGLSVSGAGDINGDGVNDFIIGAPFVDKFDSNGRRVAPKTGKSYVIFGKNNTEQPFSATLKLADIDQGNGRDGFVISGYKPHDRSGYLVGVAGDINGDGFDDLLIGAEEPGSLSVGLRAEDAYVVYGGKRFTSGQLNLESLNGTNGFSIDTGSDFRSVGSVVVNSAGDLNGDGFDDLVFGTPGGQGSGYVMYGGKSIDTEGSLKLNSLPLDGSNGFRFAGNLNKGLAGAAVSRAGDINNDGLDDLLIGAPGAGRSYVVYGSNNNPSENPPKPPITPPTIRRIVGTAERDVLTGTAADEIIIGGGKVDRLTGGGGRDQFVYQSFADRRDRITDFEAGQDTIVLTDLFASADVAIGSYSEAIDQGYLDIVSLGSRNSRVRVDLDGAEGRDRSRAVFTLQNVSALELNSADNFVL